MQQSFNECYGITVALRKNVHPPCLIPWSCTLNHDDLRGQNIRWSVSTDGKQTMVVVDMYHKPVGLELLGQCMNKNESYYYVVLILRPQDHTNVFLVWVSLLCVGLSVKSCLGQCLDLSLGSQTRPQPILLKMETLAEVLQKFNIISFTVHLNGQSGS